MTKSQTYKLLAVLAVFAAFLTLGGLGAAAAKVDGFYWAAFIINVPVYAGIAFSLIKRGERKEKEEGK